MIYIYTRFCIIILLIYTDKNLFYMYYYILFYYLRFRFIANKNNFFQGRDILKNLDSSRHV